MSRQRRKRSPLAIGCAALLALPVLLISLAIVGFATGLITIESGGSVTLPNGATVEIVTDTGGFGAGENNGESFITIGTFDTATYSFTSSQVTRDGRVLGQLKAEEQDLTFEATGGGVELRSDDTGRVIFSE